ncbi:hypothetical protein HYU06_00180 [Candidatus Woesearchaeota archaeon]|nr:hypothetical protein [Candidatus Woesearchaeota archaeon]
MIEIYHIILGALALSLVHALIPNHWIPIVLIGKSEKWTKSETVRIAGIAGFFHVVGTVMIGVLVGLMGFTITSKQTAMTRVIPAMVLVIIGLIYIFLNSKIHAHKHIDLPKKKSKFAVIGSLSVAMFFSPCIEIEAYYFTAGILGWPGIFAVSAVYFIVTIAAMLLLANLGYRSLERFKWDFLEHNEKKIIGITLVLLGILAYFVY